MEQLEQQLIDRLAQSLASIASNHIPMNQRLWDSNDCAQYLRMEKRTFVQYYAPHPKFPKPIPLDRAEGKGKMRWKAQSVIDWALKNEGKIA
jgi:predicted DNA-binding transcriptional regulator AlpA